MKSKRNKRKPPTWLTPTQIKRLRVLRKRGLPLKTLAARFGLSKSGVSRIANSNRRAA